jgi:uncharacterized protein
LIFIVGSSSPTLFAIIFILTKSNIETRKNFKTQLFSYKHKISFWFFAIVTPIILGGIFQLSYIIFKNSSIESSIPFYAYVMVLISSIIFGGIEEIGWRGFLQEKLSKYKNLILISVIIGIIWGLWHIPLFFIEEVSHNNFKFLPFLFGAIMFSTYLTWLYAKTKSLLLVVLFHASINASATIGLSLIFEHTFLSYLMIFILTIIGMGLLYKQSLTLKSTNQKKA